MTGESRANREDSKSQASRQILKRYLMGLSLHQPYYYQLFFLPGLGGWESRTPSFWNWFLFWLTSWHPVDLPVLNVVTGGIMKAMGEKGGRF